MVEMMMMLMTTHIIIVFIARRSIKQLWKVQIMR